MKASFDVDIEDPPLLQYALAVFLSFFLVSCRLRWAARLLLCFKSASRIFYEV